MSETVVANRARARRIADWLVEHQRPDEAVLLLAAWAANGPNDPEGQELLAAALRVDPSSIEAQCAFERMEGIAGQHRPLLEAIAYYDEARLRELDAGTRRPNFRRAQMGFNNNIKSHGQVFHVQTEDSGLDAPHIITHLFADGGRVIKSHKRFYAEAIEREGDGIGDFVRNLMKAQHMEMVLALREGRFDEVIAGRAIGGMEELLDPPKDDIVKRIKVGRRRANETLHRRSPPLNGPSLNAPSRGQEGNAERRVEPPPELAAQKKAEPSVQPPPPKELYGLSVMRSLSGGPARYSVTTDVAIIGSAGHIQLDGERFCHPEEAVITLRSGRLFLEDLEGGNGVFLRIRTPIEVEHGAEFIVGDQLLRVDRNPEPRDGPDPAPTYFYSSPKWSSSFRITQLLEGGAIGACAVARGHTLQIGSAVGDLVFANDPLVDEQHCVVDEQAGTIVLTDLGSRSGLFVRIEGEYELRDGDQLLVGRTRLSLKVNRDSVAPTPPPPPPPR